MVPRAKKHQSYTHEIQQQRLVCLKTLDKTPNGAHAEVKTITYFFYTR